MRPPYAARYALDLPATLPMEVLDADSFLATAVHALHMAWNEDGTADATEMMTALLNIELARGELADFVKAERATANETRPPSVGDVEEASGIRDLAEALQTKARPL